MAHEIENMMYVGQTPWHGLGIKLDSPPTIEEGIRCAGLNWKVEVRHLRLPDGRESEKARVVMRETDNAELGIVGNTFTPLQNEDAFAWFQPFVEEGLASLHTAGSLRGGERVWMLAKLAGANSEIIKGDQVEKFILLSNGHDGKMSARVGFTPIRVVCHNTLSMSHYDAGSTLIRVRHTASVKETVEELRDTMNLVNQQFEATAEQYRFLARRDLSLDDLKRYVKVVFKVKGDTEDFTKVAVEEDEMKKVFNKIIPLFEAGRGNDMKGVRGTWWAGYNAVTEYLTWERGKNADHRLNSLWFGPGAASNRRALQTAVKMAA